MIKAPVFYQAFSAGVVPLARSLGFERPKADKAKWSATLPQGVLTLDFVVNPKASAIPHCPGEFWPVITWTGPKYDDHDDGTVSWYQYTTDGEIRQIQDLRRAALNRTAAQETFENDVYRQMRDTSLAMIELGFDDSLPKPHLPHTPLYYLTEVDAAHWGAWFGKHLPTWVERFQARPETLSSWCWRVLWKDRCT